MSTQFRTKMQLKLALNDETNAFIKAFGNNLAEHELCEVDFDPDDLSDVFEAVNLSSKDLLERVWNSTVAQEEAHALARADEDFEYDDEDYSDEYAE